jgi:hypothetical protein
LERAKRFLLLSVEVGRRVAMIAEINISTETFYPDRGVYFRQDKSFRDHGVRSSASCGA